MTTPYFARVCECGHVHRDPDQPCGLTTHRLVHRRDDPGVMIVESDGICYCPKFTPREQRELAAYRAAMERGLHV